MVIEGCTQYLTKAQGIPSEIEKKLTKITRSFFWNSSAPPPVNTDTLYVNHSTGEKRLLSVPTRNQAIILQMLSTFLAFGSNRPNWTLLAEELFHANATKKYILKTDITLQNPFTQFWTTKTTHNTSNLPQYLKDMMKAAKNANTFLEPKLLSADAKAKLLIWFHLGLKGKHCIGWKLPAAICLRTRHLVITTGELINITLPEHHMTPDCDIPETCKYWAQNTLAHLNDIWNPLILPPTRNYKPLEENLYIAKPLPDPSNDLKDGFWIDLYYPPPRNCRLYRPPDDPPDILTVYMDGSTKNNGTTEATAGIGIWYGEDDSRNRALRLPQSLNRNNAAELMAILYVLQNTAPKTELEIQTDSQYSIDQITKHLHKNIQQGWIGVANREVISAIAAWLLHREQKGTNTYLRKVEGHSRDKGNDGADELTNQGARKALPENINLSSPQDYRIRGLTLTSATQELIYRSILDAKNIPTRP